MSKLVIREATAADNDALIDLERRSPLLLGDTTLVFDRSPNFFAREELLECSRMVVGEKDGRVAGVMGAARYDTLVGGEPVRAVYVHHGRVSTEHQGSGVAPRLALALLEPLLTEADLLYWYVMPENRVSFTMITRAAPYSWPRHPSCQSFRLEPRPVEPTEAPTLARPEQIEEICALMNRTHAGHDLFLPYTEATFTARLSRSPTYGWPQIFVRERGGRPVATAGLWDLGATLEVRRKPEGGEESVVRPVVLLDHGFAEGAEAEMARLLGDLGELAAGWGRQEMWMSLYLDSPLYRAMRARPHRVDSFLGLNITPDAPLPGRAATPYLDLIYW
jgi:RimJ/RimL family protein N-acetyltransferase